MIPIIKAQESLQRINELLYGTGNMRNPDSYLRNLRRQSSQLEEAANATDLSAMSPEERRAWISSRFKVVK